MSATAVDICNLALGRIGISQFINSIDEASNEGRCCKRFYDLVRDRVLAEAPWNFCTRWASLQDIGTPPTGWAYRYRYPADCLSLRKVVAGEDSGATIARGIPYAVMEDETMGGLSVCCDSSPVMARYSVRITNEQLFSPLFVNAFAWALASELAAPLSSDPRNAANAASAYQAARLQALAASLNEGIEGLVPESDYISARY